MFRGHGSVNVTYLVRHFQFPACAPCLATLGLLWKFWEEAQSIKSYILSFMYVTSSTISALLFLLYNAQWHKLAYGLNIDLALALFG